MQREDLGRGTALMQGGASLKLSERNRFLLGSIQARAMRHDVAPTLCLGNVDELAASMCRNSAGGCRLAAGPHKDCMASKALPQGMGQTWCGNTHAKIASKQAFMGLR